jgi:hypothetical protein
MSKNRALFILSIFLIVLPYIGFTKGWEDSFTVIAGIILFILTYFYVKEGRLKSPKHTIVTENKKYYDDEGDFVGGEIDVTEKVVLDSVDEEN